MGNPTEESVTNKKRVAKDETLYMIRHRCTNRCLGTYVWELVEKKIVDIKVPRKKESSPRNTMVFLGKGNRNFILEEELMVNTRIAEMDEENMLTWDYFRGTDKALRKAERWLKTANANHAVTPQ